MQFVSHITGKNKLFEHGFK